MRFAPINVDPPLRLMRSSHYEGAKPTRRMHKKGLELEKESKVLWSQPSHRRVIS